MAECDRGAGVSKLHIGDDFSLPNDAVTQTFAILGIRGSGKTNTAVVMFEEMVMDYPRQGVVKAAEWLFI